MASGGSSGLPPRPVEICPCFGPSTDRQPTSDVQIRGAGGVLFYVDQDALDEGKSKAIRKLLSKGCTFAQGIIDLPVQESTIHFVLHAICSTDCISFTTPPPLPFDTLEGSLEMMQLYKIALEDYIRPGTPIYRLILSYTGTRAIDTYALAAHHGLSALATETSAHTLKVSLPDITNEAAERMGSTYFTKLCHLHSNVVECLKDILLDPPDFSNHYPDAASSSTPTATCDHREAKKDWLLACSEIVWASNPDVPSAHIEGTLLALQSNLGCEGCKGALRTRVKEVLDEWNCVKRTI